MTLDVEQRRTLLDILSKIEEGTIVVPRIPGDIGLFIREWAEATRRARELAGATGAAGASLSGRDVGLIALTPLSSLTEKVLGGSLGEVAATVAVAEELGTTVNVTLWGDARAANQVLNNWVRHQMATVTLEGAYRWFPPRRITPGSATVTRSHELRTWRMSRCLKFVAEDFGAPPAAASYLWDEFFGPPDFRTFRVVVAERLGAVWSITSAARVPKRRTEQLTFTDWADHTTASRVVALIVREPWQAVWRVVSAEEASIEIAAAHLLGWADLKRELLDQGPSPEPELRALIAAASRSDEQADLGAVVAQADLRRRVQPRARAAAAWLRGLA